mgnify:CR=1 FL=1|tara:strand:+ start:509 stop:2104 length:1596 start_codon:yes stop_codon:yes gene_type:complete
MATITHKVIFNLDDDVIKVEDRTDYSSGYSGAIHGVVSITKNGTAFNTPGTSGSPDLTIAATEYSVGSPIQTSRVFQIENPITPATTDVWTFDYSVYPSGGSGSAELATQINFTYSFAAPAASLSLNAVTQASQITTTDSADYTSGGALTITSQTRTHKLYPPQGAKDAITGKLLPSPVDSGSSSAINYTGITTGSWSSDVSSAMEYSIPGNTGSYNIKTTLVGFASASVSSDLGLCDIYCCLKALNDRYEDAKCKNKDLGDEYKDKIESVTRLVTLYTQALDCGNTADAACYLNDIKNISECSTECNCYGEDSAPQGIPITSAVSSVSYALHPESSNLTISSSGSGSSADPVVYEMGLGAGITGDISYLAANLSVAENRMSALESISSHVKNVQDNLSTIPDTNNYSIIISGDSMTLRNLNEKNNVFSDTPLTISTLENREGLPSVTNRELNNKYTVSNIFQKVSKSIGTVIPFISSDDKDMNIQVFDVSKNSFSFRMVDKQTNIPMTYKYLKDKGYGIGSQITFKIIAK